MMLQLDIEKLEITPESVLRAQGADPEIIKARKPDLFTLAEQALQEGLPLLKAVYLVDEVKVKAVQHEKILLENRVEISGALISQHLSSSDSINAVLCTVGEEIEIYAAEVSSVNMVKGLALDGVGSAAVEALANAVCNQIEMQALKTGLQTTIPLSPGMIGWSVDQGQPVIFDLLNAAELGVELSPHFLMKPRKSLSMLIGVGAQIGAKGSTCDFCSMNATCRYQDHYRHVEK